MRLLVLGLMALLSLSCGSGKGEGVDLRSLGIKPPYPGFMGRDFNGESNFANLINNYSQGTPDPIPWAGFWWPYSSNGIASGAGGGGASPAAKYDAARGNRTSAQAWEVKNHGSGVKNVQSWWGHCNGWCVASALFPEPRESVKVNGITFTVADQKALLSEAGMEASADFYGERVDSAADYDSPKYWDTIPNHYFMILTNYVGKLRQPVLFDRYTGDQIWNQPIAAYKFYPPTQADYLGADPAAPNIYRILVTSDLWWVSDGVEPGILTPPFDWQENRVFEKRQLKMELWLDGPVVFDSSGTKILKSGNIVVSRKGSELIGGAWRNGGGYMNDAHPDYMWIPYSVLKPTEYANNQVDIDWIRKHILSGGVDDPSVRPGQPDPLPSTLPSVLPSMSPRPLPSFAPVPMPSPRPSPIRPSPIRPSPRP